MLTLKIVQAKYGDCLIVTVGDAQKTQYILVDGGPAGTYRNHLRYELEQIKAGGGALDLAVLSHVDGDHIVGLLDLTEELRENKADGTDPLIGIGELWVNSFAGTVAKDNGLQQALQAMLAGVNNLSAVLPQGNLALQSIAQGNTLRRNALLLDIPLNKAAGQEIISCETVTEAVELAGVKLRIIGPTADNLEKLRKEWLEWIHKHGPDVLTPDKELLKYMDRSVPNLSSIMFLLESAGKTILFTGDGRGDFILEGLQQAGLLDGEGRLHVDVFKVPHHGSIRNSEADFFTAVTADTYIISADGRHHNPDFETLAWIVTAAHDQGRDIMLICTNRTTSSERLEQEFPPASFGYHIQYMPEDAHSLDIKLA